METQLVLIPTISVNPHAITMYNQIDWNPRKPYRDKSIYQSIKANRTHEHLLDSSRTAEGNVSKTAKRKITKAIDYLLLFASDKKVTSVKTGRSFSFKIAFITLTLPSKQVHDDNEIKRKCLNSMLIELQKYEKVKNYVWRAEKQKNGNIHFHIIIDKFVHWNNLRNRWNRIINKLGYVDRYQESMKAFFKDGFKVREDLKSSWDETKQRKAYARNIQTDFNNPNSSDIHSIRKVHNLQHYFIKYLTTNDKPKPNETKEEINFAKQKGRIWGSSKNLQNIKGARMVVDNELETELRQIIDQTKCKAYHSDYFSVFYLDFQNLQFRDNHRIFDTFARYLVDEFGYHYQSEFKV